MTEQFITIIALAFSAMGMLLIGWFCKTVAQGSLSFSFKALGLHFEVKKGSPT
jgi:hypothetical protein